LARRHRDRLAVLAGLAAITAAAWAYVVVAAHRMTSGPGGMSGHPMAPVVHAMTGVQPWTAAESGLRLGMWAAMMVAMMVPTAVPMTLLHAAVARQAAAQHSPAAPAFIFVAGYAAMWAIFSVVATLAQRGLDQAALLSPMMVSRGAWLGAGLLIAAGAYQLTPLKNACLRTCRARRILCPGPGAPAGPAPSAWAPGLAPIAWAAAGS
jgi:predicted metal-binding membrane protein